ncbi:DMT family transporter [Halorussus salilacus]|uniref:DMT family transporter n=1 Tax=Halorussus salilacus TaxID=2953750 RepID=UPI0020A0C743|nr:DMT family transporter [Halorussus salilacus]USZ68565.1 DMT family transporter [Halorussus salilacus]
MKDFSEYRDGLLFLALAAVWGTAYPAIDVGLRALPPVTFAALRYDLAGALLLAYAAVAALRRGDRWRPRGFREWRLVGVGGLLVVGLHFALLFVGQGYVSGSIASVVMSTTPVLMPLFALVLLPDERLDRTGAVGIVLGLLGVAVVARPDPGGGGANAMGVVLLLLSAASFALGSVLTERWDADLPLVPMQAWMMVVGALALHALAAGPVGESASLSAVTPATVAALVYLAVAASVGGLLAYFTLMRRVGPNEVSLVNYAVPMFAALGEWAALGGTVEGTTVAGFLVILAGFLAVKWDALRRAATPTPDRPTPDSYSSGGGTVMVRGNVYYRDVE